MFYPDASHYKKENLERVYKNVTSTTATLPKNGARPLGRFKHQEPASGLLNRTVKGVNAALHPRFVESVAVMRGEFASAKSSKSPPPHVGVITRCASVRRRRGLDNEVKDWA